jgi:hypothetical protein
VSCADVQDCFGAPPLPPTFRAWSIPFFWVCFASVVVQYWQTLKEQLGYTQLRIRKASERTG